MRPVLVSCQVTRTHGGTAAEQQFHLQRKADRSLRFRVCNTFPEGFSCCQRRHLECAILVCVFFDFLNAGSHVFVSQCRERTGRFFMMFLQSATLVWMNHFLRNCKQTPLQAATPPHNDDLPDPADTGNGQTGNCVTKIGMRGALCKSVTLVFIPKVVSSKE